MFCFLYSFLQLVIFLFKNINFGFLIFDQSALFEILKFLIFLELFKILDFLLLISKFLFQHHFSIVIYNSQLVLLLPFKLQNPLQFLNCIISIFIFRRELNKSANQSLIITCLKAVFSFFFNIFQGEIWNERVICLDL